MKNLIAELLIKLADKEEESKELMAQIEALEIIVTGLLATLSNHDRQALTARIERDLSEARPTPSVTAYDTELLRGQLEKLLNYQIKFLD